MPVLNLPYVLTRMMAAPRATVPEDQVEVAVPVHVAHDHRIGEVAVLGQAGGGGVAELALAVVWVEPVLLPYGRPPE